jgi:hypothetical protein
MVVNNEQINIEPNECAKKVECVITCFDNGDVGIQDKFGNEINGVYVEEFFLSCGCKEITEFQQSIVDIKIVECDGTLCSLKRVGNKIYKIS